MSNKADNAKENLSKEFKEILFLEKEDIQWQLSVMHTP